MASWKNEFAVRGIALLLAVVVPLVLVGLGCHEPGVADKQNASVPARSDTVAPASFETKLSDGSRLLDGSEAGEYVGDAVCANCHKSIGHDYARTRHARTFRQVKLDEQGPFFRNGNAVKDDGLRYTYQAAMRGGKCVIVGASVNQRGTLPADYVLGAGRNACTFLSAERPDSWVDLRISYYTQRRRWDFTPGQQPGDRIFKRAAGISQEGPLLPACLSCHVTYLRAGVSGPDIAGSHIGIGCERCHGPGRAHIEALGRSSGKPVDGSLAMERYGKATPLRINALCGQCHHDEANSRDGDPKTENGLARFEGVALVRSRCFQESGALSCITCHDSHKDASADASQNEKRCLNCHSSAGAAPLHAGPAGKTCPVNKASGCIECHMPAQTIATIPYAKYHNHWIKVWKK